ncbi:hypothetical protein Phum_PHUM111070 [Pediculus humanus corporis]|uniref:Uncharacterized protein n=1 Tax=Pediculus humanus subsp. corporis TaxID=121224 RepID=E0VDC4_PEDHC|nr:uncharacterized protein Phum_PHUM111070 [Pediculus humanus corporis]EEB11380.1 hypothetical protein Phum_PHUM111070 [Pediculus humanus corporis]
MEKAYQIVHGKPSFNPPPPVQINHNEIPEQNDYNDDNLVALTAEEAGSDALTAEDPGEDRLKMSNPLPPCSHCSDDKENQIPDAFTYLDLDKSVSCDNLLCGDKSKCSSSRKRRFSDWESDDDVQNKKCRNSVKNNPVPIDLTDSEKATLLAEVANSASDLSDGENEPSNTMEIDSITSLVSIFSFETGFTNLTRSMSTPDLCSAQAKEHLNSDSSCAFLTMTA